MKCFRSNVLCLLFAIIASLGAGAQFDLKFNSYSPEPSGGDTVRIDVLATGFNEIVGMQYEMRWDSSVMELTDVFNLNPDLKDFDSNNLIHGNPLLADRLQTLWSSPNDIPCTLIDSSVLFSLRFVFLPMDCQFSRLRIDSTDFPFIVLDSNMDPLDLRNNTAFFSVNCCKHPDFHGLMNLYEATNGEQWFNHQGWKQGFEGNSCDPCNWNGGTWYGIRCNNGRVICIDLDGIPLCSDSGNGGNNLAGNLIDIKVDSLTSLYLRLNNLTGQIPDFCNLPNLEHIDLTYNLLEGQIPDFCNLPNLNYFNCTRNSLEGQIPDFSNLPNLNYFNCRFNSLEGQIPDFSNLPSLIYFSCSTNSLEGQIPDFSNLTVLEHLDLSGNLLKGQIPSFTNLLSLIFFDCSYNSLEGQIPKFISLQNLITIRCAFNSLEGQIPDFSSLTKLEYFWCESNLLEGEIPDFSNLSNLMSFFCGYNNLSECFPDFVCGLDFNSEGNMQLPWKGDHRPFCMDQKPQVGASCDDGNSSTMNDLINDDCTCGSHCTHPDLDGLLEFYNATGGESWTKNNGWKEGAAGTSCDPCNWDGGTWYGIECTNGRVTCIDLDGVSDCSNSLSGSGNKLVGNLIDFKIDSLIDLLISNNELTGVIPDFSNLPNLVSFACHSNFLEGQIPDFSNLPRLEIFYCAANSLVGVIPDFSNTPRLEIFLCGNNTLEGQIPNFSNLPRLVSFTCWSNTLSGVIPNFSNLPSLEWFDCGDNTLEGQIPDFSNLPKLKTFYCRKNTLEGQIPDFSNLQSLEYFFCDNNRLYGCYPDFVCQLDSFYSVNNPLLPWEGNHIPFCRNQELQIGASCSDGDPLTLNDAINDDCNCGSPCSHPDLDGLLEFYLATGGDNWMKKEGWEEGVLGISCDPCNWDGGTWYGIECKNGRVTCIDLDGISGCDGTEMQGNNLIGTLNDIKVDSLINLHLSFNSLTGEIPDFKYLPKLETFFCRFNILEGQIPDFSNLSNLHLFGCWGNKLSGAIPDFKNIPELTFFDAENNSLIGTIPNFTNLKKLKQFWCNYNNLSGQIPDFSNVPSLEIFDCSSNSLSGQIPDFSNLPSLESFFCSSNSFLGQIPNFSNLQSLKYFNCSSNSLSGGIPGFDNLQVLERFYCSTNNLDGCYPDYVCQLDSFYSVNNPLLPWEGNHIPFCYNQEVQIGASCSDGDPLTLNEVINDDCSCGSLCSHPDFEGLIELYEATNGDQWIDKRGWKEGSEGTSCDPCNWDGGTWYGIECKNGRVTCIDLDGSPDCSISHFVFGNKLAGNLIDIKIDSLIDLHISNNELTGQIPDFSNLSKLKWFTCNSNSLEGQIPDFSNLSNLEMFHCYNNSLEGQIPDFSNLPSLGLFHCWGNSLEGQIPNFSNLQSLVQFDCGINSLTGQIPDFSNLPSLKSFFCDNNKLDGCYPDFVCQLDSFYSVTNPLLPWEGDHTSFCYDNLNQISAPCDDGDDINSVNDMIQNDCTCKGECVVDLGCNSFIELNLDITGTVFLSADDVITLNTISCIPSLDYIASFNSDNIQNSMSFGCNDIGQITQGIYLFFEDQLIDSCNVEIVLADSNDYCSMICDPLNHFPNWTSYCPDAFIHCNTNAINGLHCTFSPSSEDKDCEPTSLCVGLGIPHNMSWFAFKAKSILVSLSIKLDSCHYSGPPNNPGALQAGIWTDCPCNGGQCIAGQSDPCFDDLDFILTNAEIGKTYFLFVDGCTNALCNYEIQIDQQNEINLECPLEPDLSSCIEQTHIDSTLSINQLCLDTFGLRKISVRLPQYISFLSYFDMQFSWSLNIPGSYIPPPFDQSQLFVSNDYYLDVQFDNADLGLYTICLDSLSFGCDDALDCSMPQCVDFEIVIPQTDRLSFEVCNSILKNEGFIPHFDEYQYTGDPIIIMNNNIQSLNLPVLNECGCEAYVEIEITPLITEELIIEIIEESGDSDDFTICEGDNFTILVNEEDLSEWYWTDPSGNNLTIFDSEILDIQQSTLQHSGTFQLLAYDLNGCSSLSEIQINIVDPEECVDQSCDALIQSEELNIDQGVDYNYNVLENDSYPAEYELIWDFKDVFGLGELNADDNGNVSFIVEEHISDTIRLEYELCPIGCDTCFVGTLSLYSDQLKDLILTNVISPNDDGTNDRLRFTQDELITGLELSIFNRWGNRIYFKEDYTNDWDAEGYPGGIYFYVIEYRGVVVKKTLTVIK